MKREINVWDYAGQIIEKTGKGGILLTTACEGKANTMTIGWGTLGIQWGKPIFIAFVRESRFTDEMLKKNPEFTVNIPLDAVRKDILSLCGTRSGRDVDKFAALGLTQEPGKTVSVPGIQELPLTLECKVIYKQFQDKNEIGEAITARYYPTSEEFPQGDYHTAYYGEITAAYIIE